MPGKSRHSKGKHPHYSKRSKALRRQATATAATQATAGMPESLQQAASAATAPVPKAASSTAKTAEIQYPYITSELRRIAILAGIIIVILVVLSIVLS
jgi:hypothetical protein